MADLRSARQHRPGDGSSTPATATAPVATPTATDWARLVVPGAIWGTSFLLIAEALESFPPILVTPLRIAIGFATLACVPAARRPIDRADHRRVALLALVWMAFPLTMFPFAEERVSSSVTGMLNGAIPLFVAAVAALQARRLPGRARAVGLLVGAVGVVLVAWPTLGEGSSSAVGIGLILAALASYGVALNLAVPLQQRHGSLPVLWRAQGWALVMVAPFGLLGVGDVSPSPGPVLAVVALGVFGTALAYVLAATNAGRLGATRASVSTYVIPVVALVLGAALRDEAVAAVAVAGCAVALLGAYLTGRST